MLRNRLFVLFFAGTLLFPISARIKAQATIPSVPTRWVTDKADFLSPETRDELDERLKSYENTTGHQVLVYIGKTIGGEPLEEWAAKTFEAWRVGRKGIDDGLVLFILAEDRKIRIEVGYGLEGVVPDAIASRVIRDILVPGIQSGERDRALREAVSSLLATISGKPEEEPPPSGRERPGRPQISIFEIVLIGLAGLFFLVLFITHPSLALWLLFSLLRGGGGGGFSGGGGRSGGGGASGSW